MDAVTVFLSKAIICFAGACHPALVGERTAVGTYEMGVLHTSQPGYGGDVLMYDRNENEWFAIHRTYRHNRVQNRHTLYHGTTAAQRRNVTSGCVDIEPETYEALKDCCRRQPLHIVP